MIQTVKRVSHSHRGRVDIIADVLKASFGGVRKTFLMYRCNLSFKQMKYYLEFMLRKRLLRVVPGDSGENPGLYEITDKGRAFLKSYKALKALMK